jgi:hypothetical protein
MEVLERVRGYPKEPEKPKGKKKTAGGLVVEEWGLSDSDDELQSRMQHRTLKRRGK